MSYYLHRSFKYSYLNPGIWLKIAGLSEAVAVTNIAKDKQDECTFSVTDTEAFSGPKYTK